MGSDATGLRIALVTTYPPDRGNLAEYGEYLSRAFEKLPGVERIDVIANQTKNAPAIEKLSERLTVYRDWQLGSAWSLMGLGKRLRALGSHIAHLNAGIRTWGKGRTVNLVGAALGGWLRSDALKVVTTLHHIGETMRLDQAVQAQLKLDPFTRAGMRLASRLYLRADLVSVTLGSMKYLLEEGFDAKNVVHVPHGTFGARVEHPPVVATPRILTFGFWGAFKDADLLVRAVKALRDEGIPAELVLGGGPHPYFPEIYSQLKERFQALPFVRFTGYVPEEELSALFTSAAVVVLPYRTNSGASGVLNLVRSYGRPVMVSNDYGLLEQLRHEGGAGLVFDGLSSLVDGLRRVLTDATLQTQMGAANLEIARRLTIETQAARFLEHFRALRGGTLKTSPETLGKGATLQDLGDRATLFSWPPGV